MNRDEFDAFRQRAIKDYAAARARAGNWHVEQAEALERETDRLLPAGVATPGMLFLTAEASTGEPVGMVWVALKREGTGGAWIYAIEVFPPHRGRGFGRALLAATEREVARHGVLTLALNVFSDNAVARHLYESSGYRTLTLEMGKQLDPAGA